VNVIMRIIYCFAFLFSFAVARSFSQEQPGPVAPGQKPAANADNPYADLTKSKDLKTKGLAERYGNLIKYQEWGTASGKSIVAKYVSHDADMKHVKLAVPKGTGKDRATQEYDVALEKLNKTSQARVKQIDTLQKKLDELASAEPKNGEAGVPPAGPEGAEGRGRTARGRYGRPAKGRDAAIAGPDGAQAPSTQPQATQQAQAPAEDPSASEPDPLGFAELQPVSAGPEAGPGPGAGPIPNPDGGPGSVPPSK
jgi:hypothetical protein